MQRMHLVQNDVPKMWRQCWRLLCVLHNNITPAAAYIRCAHLIDVRNNLLKFGVRYLALCTTRLSEATNITSHTSTFIKEHFIPSIRLKVSNINKIINSAIDIRKCRLIRSKSQLFVDHKAIGVFPL